MTRVGLAIGAGALAALLSVGTAGAAPSAQSATAGTSQAAAKARPAPVTGHAAPSAKTGKASTPGGALTAHLDGNCDLYASGTGDLCMWYFSNFSGSLVDFYTADDYMWDNVFLTAGSGQGAVVANNSESAWNYDTIYTAWVCADTFQQGACGYVLPWSGGNFVSPWFNGVESLHWAL